MASDPIVTPPPDPNLSQVPCHPELDEDIDGLLEDVDISGLTLEESKESFAKISL